ncbi:unnamed protein product [Spirodela intermedia]|uniref:Uncharacterized protein n=1 Tax=Spirodela intermedia TaxID=51605 RepID=A0A7I8JP52_SPIIN|nr:unnamed protein product [Spirodela intermedia]CAA6671232.1 unnamed protein product [Spirodela intermedia]
MDFYRSSRSTHCKPLATVPSRVLQGRTVDKNSAITTRDHRAASQRTAGGRRPRTGCRRRPSPRSPGPSGRRSGCATAGSRCRSTSSP